jgi:hypothetical protein
VEQQDPGVDQVERPAVKHARVGDVIFDVARTGVRGVLSGQLHDLGIEVHPGDQSAWAGDAGHVERDVAAAAAQVQAPVAAAQPASASSRSVVGRMISASRFSRRLPCSPPVIV